MMQCQEASDNIVLCPMQMLYAISAHCIHWRIMQETIEFTTRRFKITRKCAFSNGKMWIKKVGNYVFG